MGAPTEYYVDPSIDAASGSGTIGDPYGDLQHAMDSVTRDATNGDRFNVKAGTAEVLTAALDFTTYGTATDAAPVIFQGYTSAAEDGGQGEIDGNATYSILAGGAYDFVKFANMKLGNCGGTNYIINADNDIELYACHLHTSTAMYGFNVDNDFVCVNCFFDTANEFQIRCRTPYMYGNYFVHTGSGPAIDMEAAGRFFFVRNTVKLSDAGADALWCDSASNVGLVICNNSIYQSAAGTGYGIYVDGFPPMIICNNLIEGFSGVGGIGLRVVDGRTATVAGNGFYNCATNISGTPVVINEDNESLGASPFASTTTFQPADTGNVISGAYPTADIGSIITYYMDKGAVQLEPSAGGGGCKLVGPGGGMIG